MSADLAALRAYVTAEDKMQHRSPTTKRVNVSHSNLKSTFMEIKVDLRDTVGEVKRRLMTHCGTNVSAMTLVLRNADGAAICAMNDDGKMLGYYGVEDGMEVRVVDDDPHSMSAHGWLEDVSKVEKYVMSDEEYERREGTYRRWKREQVEKDPTWTLEKEMARRRGAPYVEKDEVNDDTGADEAKDIVIGARCEVNPGQKRGEVKFVGRCEALPPGFWVGIQFDEPVGKNDGSVNGKRVFECMDGYGSFQRPKSVSCGDYPAIDDVDFSEDEI